MKTALAALVVVLLLAPAAALAAPRFHPSVPWYVSKQILIATKIGRESRSDPWPNCPDPIWNGARSWSVTVACENHGSWLDSPGYYRCGLQFDPGWERRYGRLCP